MTRTSDDLIRNGRVWDGFDYSLQVWIVEGIVQRCGHPARMREHGPCCNQDLYAGRPVAEIPGAEHFTTDRRI
jgi:hypothetical protein